MMKDIDAGCEFLLSPTLPKLGICPRNSNWIYPVTTELHSRGVFEDRIAYRFPGNQPVRLIDHRLSVPLDPYPRGTFGDPMCPAVSRVAHRFEVHHESRKVLEVMPEAVGLLLVETTPAP